MSRLLAWVSVVLFVVVNTSFAQAPPAQRPTAAAKPAAQPAILASPDREHPHPTITSIKGVGTANAMAEARVTARTITEYCAERARLYTSAAECAKQQQSQFGTKVFRASADCTAGRITTTGDQAYALDGLWDSTDVGGGRTRWRDSSGAIAERDPINNGLHISQQWETLCPAPVTAAYLARVKAQASAKPPAPPRPASVDECVGKTRCYDAGNFVAEILLATPSISKATYDYHVITLSVRFRNKTDQPVVLAYVPQSASMSDNFGNSYRPSSPEVRGMGTIQGNKADPQFALQPGESRAATFIQARALPRAGGQPMGESYTLTLPITELQVLYNGQQIRTVRENSMSFPNFALGSGTPPAVNVGAPPPSPATAPPVSAAPPAVPLPDQCGGRLNCYDAGLFVAEIVQATPSIAKATYNWHVVTLNVRFRNKTDQSLVLAYVPKSASLSDNFGNRYVPSNPLDVKGMGTIQGNQADPQFVLRPGESRAATFMQARELRVTNQPMGQSFTLMLPITELEVLYNGQQIKTVRENSMTFANFTLGGGVPGAPNSETVDNIKKAGEAIRGLFGGKK